MVGSRQAGWSGFQPSLLASKVGSPAEARLPQVSYLEHRQNSRVWQIRKFSPGARCCRTGSRRQRAPAPGLGLFAARGHRCPRGGPTARLWSRSSILVCGLVGWVREHPRAEIGLFARHCRAGDCSIPMVTAVSYVMTSRMSLDRSAAMWSLRGGRELDANWMSAAKVPALVSVVEWSRCVLSKPPCRGSFRGVMR
jgi:hypothetical protein